jgi:hypothetical protein
VDVMTELRQIGALYASGDVRAGLGKIQSLWAAVPEPKAETLNAYMIVEYGVAFSLKDGDLGRVDKG